jgi:hypothetical protein
MLLLFQTDRKDTHDGKVIKVVLRQRTPGNGVAAGNNGLCGGSVWLSRKFGSPPGRDSNLLHSISALAAIALLPVFESWTVADDVKLKKSKSFIPFSPRG